MFKAALDRLAENTVVSVSGNTDVVAHTMVGVRVFCPDGEPVTGAVLLWLEEYRLQLRNSVPLLGV